MDLKNICVVLARPEESRNVGAACRAMANCGIECLRIVGDKNDFDENHVRTLALHAAYVWEGAEFFSSIAEACADCVMSAATTRRRGKKRKGKLYQIEEFIGFAKMHGNGKTAVVFGNERTGLTDEEIDECSIALTIPTSEKFPSMNLSHAVQVVCHDIFRAEKKATSGIVPIDLSRLEKTVGTISASLEQIGFFTLAGKTDMEKFWRGVLARAALSEAEAKYVEKVFTKAAGLAGRK